MIRGTNDDPRNLGKRGVSQMISNLLTCWIIYIYIKDSTNKPFCKSQFFVDFFQNSQRYSIICYLKTATFYGEDIYVRTFTECFCV